MDLKLEDVSALLNVSEAKVKKWVDEGKIPSYKLGAQLLFSRSEVEDWLMRFGLPRPAVEESGFAQFSLTRALHKGGILRDNSTTKKECIKATTQTLAKTFEWDADVIFDLLMDREELMPTALGCGIAVPHAREFLLETHFDVVTIVFPKESLNWGALDGKAVHTLFFLFACEDKRHLNLLAKIAHLCSDPKRLEFFASKPSDEDLLAFIRDFETKLK